MRIIELLPVSNTYLRATPTAAGPQTGWAYRTGSGGANSGAPKFQFSEFRQNHRKNELSKRAFEEPLCRKCSWRACATFHRRISCYLSRGSVCFLDLHIFLLILCADFELGAPFGDLRLPGSGLKGRSVSLDFDLVRSYDFMA